MQQSMEGHVRLRIIRFRSRFMSHLLKLIGAEARVAFFVFRMQIQ